MIRFPLSLAMLALCLIALQCTASDPDRGNDGDTHDNGGDVGGGGGGGSGDPIPGGNPASTARTEDAEEGQVLKAKAAQPTFTTTTDENKASDTGNPGGSSSPDVSTVNGGPEDSSPSSSSSSVANKGADAADLASSHGVIGNPPSAPSLPAPDPTSAAHSSSGTVSGPSTAGTGRAPSANVALGAKTGPATSQAHSASDASEAGGNGGQKGPGGTGTGDIGTGGQGNTHNSGAGVTGPRLSTSEPDSSDLSGTEKHSDVGGRSTVLVPGSGGERTRPGDIVIDGGSTGTGRSPSHSLDDSSISPGSKIPSRPKAPVREEVISTKDAPGGSNGNKALSPAPQKPSTPTKPAAKDTNTQTTDQATSGGRQPAVKLPTATPSTSTVAQQEQKPKASNHGEKDKTPLQTLKSTTLTSAPKDSTQASVTSTTESAKGESTAPETSLPKLSKTLQSVDKNDGSNESLLLVAFTVLVTLVVMAVVPAL